MVSVAFGSIVGATGGLTYLRSRSPSRTIVVSALSVLVVAFLSSGDHSCSTGLYGAGRLIWSWLDGGAASKLWVALQRAARDSVRGRVSAMMMTFSQGGIALGALLLGLIANQLGTSAAFPAAATLLLILAVVLGFPRAENSAIRAQREIIASGSLAPNTLAARIGPFAANEVDFPSGAYCNDVHFWLHVPEPDVHQHRCRLGSLNC